MVGIIIIRVVKGNFAACGRNCENVLGIYHSFLYGSLNTRYKSVVICNGKDVAKAKSSARPVAVIVVIRVGIFKIELDLTGCFKVCKRSSHRNKHISVKISAGKIYYSACCAVFGCGFRFHIHKIGVGIVKRKLARSGIVHLKCRKLILGAADNLYSEGKVGYALFNGIVYCIKNLAVNGKIRVINGRDIVEVYKTRTSLNFAVVWVFIRSAVYILIHAAAGNNLVGI